VSEHAPSPQCGERYLVWLERTGEVRSQEGLESGVWSLKLGVEPRWRTIQPGHVVFVKGIDVNKAGYSGVRSNRSSHESAFGPKILGKIPDTLQLSGRHPRA
jgi:hypothetical protein